MVALWDEPTPTFTGDFVSFSGVVERPRPVQRPHPPIVCGGHAPAALRRAATAGDGWYGWELGPDEVAATVATLRELGERHGRPPDRDELEITVTPPQDLDLAMARRYAEAGVHRLVVQPSTSEGTAIDELIETVGSRYVGQA